MLSLETEIKNCKRCELCKNMPLEPIPGYGFSLANIMFVNDTTSKDDSIVELPFQGFAGKFLDKFLESLGLKKEEVYFTNLVKCLSKDEPTQEQINQCKHWIYKEIETVKPRIIIACGKLSARTLIPGIKKSFKLKDYIGKAVKIDWAENTWVIPCVSMVYLMNQGGKEIVRITELMKNAIQNNTNNI